jgi:hypothetical protein
LVVAFAVVMSRIRGYSSSQWFLTEEDHSDEDLGFQGTEKPLQMGVQIPNPRRQRYGSHAFVFEDVLECRTEFAISASSRYRFTQRRPSTQSGIWQTLGGSIRVWRRAASSTDKPRLSTRSFESACCN